MIILPSDCMENMPEWLAVEHKEENQMVMRNRKKEALEFLAKKYERFYDKPLKELRLKENCLVACIIRQSEVIIPNGNSCIQHGDNVIVVTTHNNFDDLADIFE